MRLILSGKIYTNRYVRDDASFRRSVAQNDACTKGVRHVDLCETSPKYQENFHVVRDDVGPISKCFRVQRKVLKLIVQLWY